MTYFKNRMFEIHNGSISGSSETLVTIYKTTRRHIPDGCNIPSHRHVNLASDMNIFYMYVPKYIKIQ
jgi:hypothetical protein